jgi:hypothetical protein
MEGGAVGHNFERDHPWQVGLIWFSGFREEDLNVIFYQNNIPGFSVKFFLQPIYTDYAN